MLSITVVHHTHTQKKLNEFYFSCLLFCRCSVCPISLSSQWTRWCRRRKMPHTQVYKKILPMETTMAALTEFDASKTIQYWDDLKWFMGDLKYITQLQDINCWLFLCIHQFAPWSHRCSLRPFAAAFGVVRETLITGRKVYFR